MSKGSYELVEVQLDATRTAMGARQAAAQERITELEAEVADLQGQLRGWQTVLAERDARLGALEEQLNQSREREILHLVEEACPAPPEDEAPDGEEEPVVEPRPDADAIAALVAAIDRHERAERLIDNQHHQAEHAFEALLAAGRVELLRDGDDTLVRVPVHVLFQEGRVLLSPLGQSVLEEMATALRQLPGRTVRIEGHTHVVAHHSVQFASNWELGFGRAVAVLRWLDDHDVNLPLSAGSWGSLRPVRDDDDDGARRLNERVELRLALDLEPILPTVDAEDDGDEGDEGDGDEGDGDDAQGDESGDEASGATDDDQVDDPS